MSLTLTSDQTAAFELILTFLREKQGTVFVLHGQAGTGKTTLVKKLIQAIVAEKLATWNEIIGISPTHKACKILQNVAPVITIKTVSAFLMKRTEHSYVGAKRYSNGSIAGSSFKIVLLDEVSMVPDSDYEKLVETAGFRNMRIIAIGDKYQIPAPSQHFIPCIVDEQQVYVKAPSIAFSNSHQYELKEIVRQVQNSPIITLATTLRNNIYEDDALLPEDIPAEMFLPEMELGARFKQFFIQNSSCKIITYTNANVAKYNSLVRKELYENTDIPFYKGEILTGYGQNGLIENGRDYTILDVRHSPAQKEWLVTIEDGVLLFPMLEHPIMDKIIPLARKVNSHKSTRADYAKYINTRSHYYFIENIYEFEGKLINEKAFRAAHPLLFSLVTTIQRDDLLRKKIRAQYPDLLERRLRDNKPISDQEQLCSSMCILEKDVNYGYACTAHKSQGSTFHRAFVDLASFDRIENRVVRGRLEFRIQERNQLKYVACTRAAKNLFILQ